MKNENVFRMDGDDFVGIVKPYVQQELSFAHEDVNASIFARPTTPQAFMHQTFTPTHRYHGRSI